MELISFKTNIKSVSALNRVAPFLDWVVGSTNWQLDLKSTDKKLTVFQIVSLMSCMLKKLLTGQASEY